MIWLVILDVIVGTAEKHPFGYDAKNDSTKVAGLPKRLVLRAHGFSLPLKFWMSFQKNRACAAYTSVQIMSKHYQRDRPEVKGKK